MIKRCTKALPCLLIGIQVKLVKGIEAGRKVMSASYFRMPKIVVDNEFLGLSARMSRWRVGGPF